MVCCIAAAVLVGCTSDSKGNGLNLGTTPAASSTSTTIAAATTTTTTTTMVTVAPTVEGTTTAATKNPTTSSATPPTSPPTDTTSISTAPATVEAQVEADYLAARQVRQNCTYDPASCDFASIAIPDSPMDRKTRATVQQRLADNLRGKPGFGDVLVRVESVKLTGDSAFATVCTYDTGVLFDIADPANPDDDIIFNDQKHSYRVRWELHQLGGRWLMYTGTGLDDASGSDLCGF